MPYVVDGYNLMHVMGLLKKRAGPTGLQKARNRLLGIIAGALGDRSKEVTVVFDAAGAPEDAPAELNYQGVRVRFARKTNQADDLIEEMVQNYSAPRQLRVVSNDHRLIKAAKRRRCISLSCDKFLDWLESKHRGRRPKPAEPSEKVRGLPAHQAERWLEEFADIAKDPRWDELSSFPPAENE